MKNILLIIASALPAALSACSVCMGKSLPIETINAYAISTAALSAIPILFASGIFYWLYRRNKDSDRGV